MNVTCDACMLLVVGEVISLLENLPSFVNGVYELSGDLEEHEIPISLEIRTV